MQLLNNKVDNEGATAEGQLPSTEFNQAMSELQNIITTGGITLSGGDLAQAAKAVAAYSANGTFYVDSGGANVYVVSVIAPRLPPPAYIDGMLVSFLVGTTNTTTSTINVAALGVKDLVDRVGNVLDGGELVAGELVTARYSIGSDKVQLVGILANGLFTDFVNVGGGRYLRNDTTAVTFDIGVNITQGGAFQSVGPTGSGADNIFTGLDGLPANAKSVYVQVNGLFVEFAPSASTAYFASIFARATGSNETFNKATEVFGKQITTNTVLATVQVIGVTRTWLPVDSNLTFELATIVAGSTTLVANLYLMGFSI